MGKNISPLIVGVTAWLIVSQIVLPSYEETLKPMLVDKVHTCAHTLSLSVSIHLLFACLCVYVSIYIYIYIYIYISVRLHACTSHTHTFLSIYMHTCLYLSMFPIQVPLQPLTPHHTSLSLHPLTPSHPRRPLPLAPTAGPGQLAGVVRPHAGRHP